MANKPTRLKTGKVPGTGEDLSEVSPARWSEAERRLECLKPLFVEKRDREMMEKQAKKYGYSVSTLYNWLAKFGESERKDVTLLIPPKPNGGKGGFKIDRIFWPILETAKKAYLSPAKPTIGAVVRDCQLECRTLVTEIIKRNAAKMRARSKVKRGALEVVPEKLSDGEYIHANTIRYQIKQLSTIDIDIARNGKAGRHKHELNRGEFPQPSLPLEVVQLDHTKMDVMVVDDEFGQSIGRAYITVAIDVWSRAVTGYCLSLDPSGLLTTGICLAHSILSKDTWLLEHNVPAKWPISGKPRAVLLDNAMEFHSQSLITACGKHGINLEYRPLGKPHFAGHIESFMKTLAQATRELSGATYSNIFQKGETNPEELAEMTFNQLEHWLALLICTYNQQMHSATFKAPVVRFLEGIELATREDFMLGSSADLSPEDEEELLIDFLPAHKSTIQKYGIRFYYHNYRSDDLSKYVGLKDPKTKKGREYVFRYDPRDMRTIYLYSPEERRYFTLKTPAPRFSLWEAKAAISEAKKRGRADIDQELIDDMILKRREIAHGLASASKQARRSTQRVKEAEIKSASYVRPEPTIPPAAEEPKGPKKVYRPYDDIKVGW